MRAPQFARPSPNADCSGTKHTRSGWAGSPVLDSDHPIWVAMHTKRMRQATFAPCILPPTVSVATPWSFRSRYCIRQSLYVPENRQTESRALRPISP